MINNEALAVERSDADDAGLPERQFSKTGIYHVMLRGINKQLIFEEQEDYLRFLSCLSEVKKISGFKLFAYCLMGNHLHLLIKEEGEPLAQIFKRIGARYVFWFNWKYDRSGHLFQDRFRSEPVESDDYFLMVLAYIYQNPVKAGLCRRPEDYEWCSRKLLGNCELVDEAELFEIMSIKGIKNKELEELDCEFLEPKIGRRLTLSDAEAFAQMKAVGGVENVAEFQALERGEQAKVFFELKTLGASMRQLARLSGIGRGVVERLCRDGQAA